MRVVRWTAALALDYKPGPMHPDGRGDFVCSTIPPQFVNKRLRLPRRESEESTGAQRRVCVLWPKRMYP
jgi:hypothetical protein